MFNLLRSEQQVIKEIHNAFDIAEDVLLKEADAVLAELNIQTQSQIEEKAKLATLLGFVNSPSVAKSIELNRKISITSQLAMLIREYKQTYPFQKFLTETELDKICTKYNLIYAPIKNYKEDVPLKNLKEIASAPSLIHGHRVMTLELLKCEQCRVRVPLWIRKKLKGGIETGNVYIPDNNKFCREYFDIDYDVCEYSSLYWSIEKVKRDGLFIAAPKSHFDLKGLKKTSKFSFNIVTEVKDPIVFRYIKGGVQVLSKWGMEASDEMLVNEINN